ncbi:MAG TPA: adenosylcobalamin-dependent ribonucleoside-diphosphate reductase [Patescibacteria group bacterium]|nr:adenosylcobalamin-dependent ribonucleoside-diphosphate reductase [Patescibacteria group bacterium]
MAKNAVQLDGVRQKVFLDRYSLKDKKGDPIEQEPTQMWRRVSDAIASVEKTPTLQKTWSNKFYNAMEDFKFVPGGRVLAGAGTGYAVTFYNCFVIPSPKDSRDGILDNLKNMIEIMARGGGVGVNISSLRPRGARVKKVNGFSSGPINWAGMYSLATHDIIQQGGSRRGALMLMLWDWHPDIEEFITVKQDLTKINGANLSICVSDSFMEAVKNDGDWDLVFPDLDDPEYDAKWDGILDHWKKLGKKVTHYKTVRARDLWEMICTAAWRSAEPGLVFMERYNKWYNNWYWNTINCVNPCGEEGLPAWGVCNLASLNLSAFVKGYEVDKPGTFDYASLAEHARIAVRFQDNVVDADQYIYPEIEEMQHQGERRIGLGTLGLGDALIKMHLRYGSEDSLPVVDKIYKTIRDAAYDESINISKEKGAFPKINVKKHLQGYFIKQLPKEIKKKMKQSGIRNSMLLQAAPTGTTSLLSGASSGIEPVYEFEYYHMGRLGKQLVYHHIYGDWKKKHPNEARPDYFVAANDLTPENHVKVQATVQKYVDASISKTVNAPNAHTIEDVKKLYMMAYDAGCKGVTYMRDGSRQAIFERVPEKKDTSQALVQEEQKPATPITPRVPRPMVLTGVTYKTESPIGKMYITINQDEKNDPFEVFINHGKSGSDVTAMADALGRMISFVLRIHSSVPARERMREMVSELTGIGGARSVGFGENRVRSLPDAIAKVLAKHSGFKVNGKVEDKQATVPFAEGEVTQAVQAENGASQNTASTNSMSNVTNGHMTNGHTTNGASSIAQQLPLETKPQEQVQVMENISVTSLFDICPDCGSGTLAYEEGCKKCYSCGYSEC